MVAATDVSGSIETIVSDLRAHRPPFALQVEALVSSVMATLSGTTAADGPVAGRAIQVACLFSPLLTTAQCDSLLDALCTGISPDQQLPVRLGSAKAVRFVHTTASSEAMEACAPRLFKSACQLITQCSRDTIHFPTGVLRMVTKVCMSDALACGV